MTDTKPTDGALRAAQIILGPNTIGFTPDEAARMFDRESGLRELVEAAQLLVDFLNTFPESFNIAHPGEGERLVRMRSALARVKGE